MHSFDSDFTQRLISSWTEGFHFRWNFSAALAIAFALITQQLRDLGPRPLARLLKAASVGFASVNIA